MIGILCVIIIYDNAAFSVILQSISDAYLQVSAFVFAALYIFYALEKLFNINALKLLANKQWEVPFAAFLGAIPGCGGAIVVVTQYVKGRQSFGALTAALIATMGDAAFLLIAREPLTGMMIIIIGFVVGCVFGMLVNALHGVDFMRGEEAQQSVISSDDDTLPVSPALLKIVPWLDRIWLLWMIPGVIFAILLAIQFAPDGAMAYIMLILGGLGGVLCWVMYILMGQQEEMQMMLQHQQETVPYQMTLRNFIDDTNFVTVWVLLAFLLFDVTIYLTNFDLRILFDTIAIFVPLMAILVGFIPGCGPQILVTTLYLNGFIPLSALFGNAISNDGDALFPALALAKKPAVIATLYSAVPALILAYGYYFLVE